MRWLGIWVLVLVASLPACDSRAPVTTPVAELAADLPDQVEAFASDGTVEVYDAESIFAYIDGHAEVFLAYGMKGCASKHFQGAGASVVVDIFRMASAADAYGVFTHDLDGEDVGIGQGSRYRWGWLSFWQGEFFVSITVDDESEQAVAAVHELGRLIASRIDERGELPTIVQSLPTDGLDPTTVRYLYNAQILSTHRFVGVDNPLQLDVHSPAALAAYRVGESTALLLVVLYPDQTRAGTALAAVTAALELDPSGAPVHAGRGWQAAATTGERLALVLDASDAQTATAILAQAVPSDPGGSI